MNSMLSSSSSSFLLLSFSSLLLVFPPYSSMDVYKDCSNRFSCGNITGVEYPFSGEGRPPDCGHPDLKLSCNNRSLTTMEINNVTYNVLEINQKTQILKISSDDLFDGLCSPKFSIATIDPYDDLFEYAPDSQQVTILYDCLSPSAPFIPPALPPASVHSVSHLSASASHTKTVFTRNVSSLRRVAGRASAPSPVPGRAAAPSPVFVPGRASAPDPVPPIPVPVPASAPSPVPGPASPSAVLDCPSGSTYKSAFITTESQAALPCNWTIRVGILRSYVNGDMGNLSKMEEAMRQGFAVKYKMDTGACRECTESGGSCGYNWTTNQSTCYCAGHNPSPSETKCPPPPTESSSIHDLIIGISASVVGLLIIFAVFLSIYKRGAIIFWKKENTEEFDVEAFIRNFTSFAPKRYTYSHVKKMTNSFKNVIGKGGFGCVYKGTLPDGRLVAVKVLIESKGNGEDFINEVASMGRTSHVNIVTLVGFCLERKKRALIYDFMPNGSLDKFIFNQENGSTSRCLEWRILYEIALGVARGLEYLHRGCNTRILHFDIKPQNILLDKDFCPKISDFGLAKLWLNKESIVSMVGAKGTAGYIAPEVFRRNFGGASHKSDVYSYGMLVLEMVGGRRNIDCSVSHTSEIYFPYWIYEDVELGKDLRVLGVTTEEEKEIARKMVLVSLWCIQTIPSDRPPMSKVVDMLEGNLQSVQIPPKPLLFSPARSPH